MDNIKIYEISAAYIDYLVPHAPHLFHNRKKRQANERKYIGIVLQVNGMDYFAPLSSFKPKHKAMKEGLDFIKIKDYAVINLNNMFPVPARECSYTEKDMEIIKAARKANKDKRVEQRLKALELQASGKKAKEIAEITGFHPG